MSQPADRFLKDTRSSLAKLVGTSAHAHVEFTDFPGGGRRFEGVKWCLWSLTSKEVATSCQAAYEWCRKTCGWSEEAILAGDGRGILAMATKAFQLALALRNPDDHAIPFADGGPDVLDVLEPDEIGVMYERFLDWNQQRSPLQAMDPGEMEGFVEALGKGWTSPSSLSSYDSVTTRSMLLFTARALYRQTKDSSSDTSPASDSSDSSTIPTP